MGKLSVMPYRKRKKMGMALLLKWRLFRVFEFLSIQREKWQGKNFENPANKVALSVLQNDVKKQSVWVFLSTIGELNAIKPFLDKMTVQYPGRRIVLITDHEHYRAAYLAKFSSATIFICGGTSDLVWQLAQLAPPELLVIGEIPCMLSDAPCRFPFAVPYYAKKFGAKILLINGWLYKLGPNCTIDTIEKKLFEQDYFDLIDFFGVQNDNIQQTLVSTGLNASKIAIMGNIKFDVMNATRSLDTDSAMSPDWLRWLQGLQRPRVVAGCVSEFEEQVFVLEAFQQFRKHNNDAMLVLAPRHPEFLDRMQRLEAFLQGTQLNYLFKTTAKGPPERAVDVLVLDTVGELKDFYAVGDAAYVGVDHNILEPMAYGKPVFVGAGWFSGYPSYPVYQMLKSRDCVFEYDESEKLGNAWNEYFESEAVQHNIAERIKSVVQSEIGAVERAFAYLEKI